MSTPTEAHRKTAEKLIWQLCNLHFETVGEANEHTAKFLCDSEARAVEAATKDERKNRIENHNNHQEAWRIVQALEADLTAARERVRVLEEALEQSRKAFLKIESYCQGAKWHLIATEAHIGRQEIDVLPMFIERALATPERKEGSG